MSISEKHDFQHVGMLLDKPKSNLLFNSKIFSALELANGYVPNSYTFYTNSLPSRPSTVQESVSHHFR